MTLTLDACDENNGCFLGSVSGESEGRGQKPSPGLVSSNVGPAALLVLGQLAASWCLRQLFLQSNVSPGATSFSMYCFDDLA
eukprot:scaffold6959_cov175-Skeletonema_dohrnii-CCMP3373.AAC.2